MTKLFRRQFFKRARGVLSDSYYKSSDQILVVNRQISMNSWSTRQSTCIFDFEFRTMTVITEAGSTRERIETFPFPALDPATLRGMRDKLTDLGGHPLPLGPEADPKRAFAAPATLRSAQENFKP